MFTHSGFRWINRSQLPYFDESMAVVAAGYRWLLSCYYYRYIVYPWYTGVQTYWYMYLHVVVAELYMHSTLQFQLHKVLPLNEYVQKPLSAWYRLSTSTCIYLSKNRYLWPVVYVEGAVHTHFCSVCRGCSTHSLHTHRLHAHTKLMLTQTYIVHVWWMKQVAKIALQQGQSSMEPCWGMYMYIYLT